MSSRKSASITLVAAIIGLMTAVCGFATQLGSFGDFRLPVLPGVDTPDGEPDPDQDDPFGGCNPAQRSPELQLSDGSGPSGAGLTVSGTDFCPEVRVTIRFHTEQIAFAQTDADGAFSAEVTVPGTFDFAAPAQFDIVARGQFVSARTPFELTR